MNVHQRGTFRIEKSSTINFYYRKVIDNLSLIASNLCSFAIEKKSKMNSSIRKVITDEFFHVKRNQL